MGEFPGERWRAAELISSAPGKVHARRVDDICQLTVVPIIPSSAGGVQLSNPGLRSWQKRGGVKHCRIRLNRRRGGTMGVVEKVGFEARSRERQRALLNPGTIEQMGLEARDGELQSGPGRSIVALLPSHGAAWAEDSSQMKEMSSRMQRSSFQDRWDEWDSHED